MKVFISQPMNGKTDEEIKKERNDAIVKIREKCGADVEILDSFFQLQFHNKFQKVNKGIYYLGRSLKLMASADVVVCIGNWKEYRGCKFEHDIAVAYYIPIIEL